MLDLEPNYSNDYIKYKKLQCTESMNRKQQVYVV